MRVRLLLIGLTTVLACTAVKAEGESSRRLAAELVVMAGDARRLTGDEGRPLEREGLTRRLAGALSSLPLLLRRADGDARPVTDMREALARRDWRALSTALHALRKRHPFDARPLLAAAPTPALLALGASIHHTTCAGCHNAATSDTLLPAFNLSKQITTMPREEFGARLLLGVRGDRMTVWRNPFSDLELAALIAWYASGR